LIEREIREVEADIQWFQDELDQESLPARPEPFIVEFCDQYGQFLRYAGKRWQCSIDGRHWVPDRRARVLSAVLRQFLQEQKIPAARLTFDSAVAIKDRLAVTSLNF